MMVDQPDKLSCGAVLVRETESSWVTLMLRAYRNWDFPKGLCEAGETPLQAAMREVGEETGITDLSFDWGERFTDTGPYNQGKVARYFLARTEEERLKWVYRRSSGARNTTNTNGWTSIRRMTCLRPVCAWSCNGRGKSSAPNRGQSPALTLARPPCFLLLLPGTPANLRQAR